ncbi:MAG: hypothetical protein K2X27_21880 [Candidatus Obscuribacterales bacterium]|nr:hypothetical protein [Candidatus Obscuribacterales bacterium]
MLRQKLSICLVLLAASLSSPESKQSCLAADGAAPAINASGAGMTNAQLDATRPVLSGLKSINDAIQSVSDIRDKAKDILHECTTKPPTVTQGDYWDSRLKVSGPYSHTNGQYYVASKWKLVEIDKEIVRQQSFLAQILATNQQDHRALRASEETQKQIEALRADARVLTSQMIEDANKLTGMVAVSNPSQTDVIAAAKTLIRSTDAVDSKLKQMDKVLKREEKKSQ